MGDDRRGTGQEEEGSVWRGEGTEIIRGVLLLGGELSEIGRKRRVRRGIVGKWGFLS